MAELRHIATNTWIPLMEYAIKRGVSLSTLRRHIKANKLAFKVENGRYLLWDSDTEPLGYAFGSSESLVSPELSESNGELQRLTQDLQKAREEIVELKTLIALYEEGIP